MEPINNNMLDGIRNYLSMESTGALMVSGEWGCGKTYHIEKVVMPALQQDGWNPVKVSLFGIESVNEMPLRIADNYKRPENNEVDGTKKEKKKSWLSSLGKEKAGKALAKGAQFASKISWLGNFVDVETLVNNNSGLLYKLIPTEKTVIILDDIERVIDTIDVHTLLGAINDLVEHRGYKVVVIANNSYMQQKDEAKLVFKEKVIEKTLVYEPDVVSIFKELCGKNCISPFTEFMTAQKAVKVIDPCFPSYKEDKGLRVELHNIRILKFALAHFCKIYEVCNVFLKNENKDLADRFLLSLWASTVGVSIEYKKDRLTYKDRSQFSQYVELSAIDWEFDDGGRKADGLLDEMREDEAVEKQKEEKQREYTNRRVTYIFEKLVKAHDFPVIVSPQMFDFVTAGMSLDKDALKAVWEGYKSQEQRNSTNPAYSLLEKLMHSQWNMSNEEMVDYNPQIQFSPKSETKRPKIELPHKTKRSKNHKRTTPKMQPFQVAFLVSTNRLKQALNGIQISIENLCYSNKNAYLCLVLSHPTTGSFILLFIQHYVCVLGRIVHVRIELRLHATLERITQCSVFAHPLTQLHNG